MLVIFEFPNRHTSDSWEVGMREADHGEPRAGAQ